MLQNIKVDIIYYLINTDFEMEFNLCGCCRMRLLTDKASDRKSFINMLSRAVSRSRIIIACGGLFSGTGLIHTVAQAVGKPLETASNAEYGIKGDSEIKIISGSIPLVTPEGYFGGCIIESGPQTIILLSENRNIRKSIMKNLIHPYIEEFSMNAASESAARGVHESAQIVPKAESVPEVPNADISDNLPEMPETTVETESGESESESATEENESSEITPEEDVVPDTENFDTPAEETENPNKPDTFEFVFEDDGSDEEPIRFSAEETEIPMHLVPERMKPGKTGYYDIEYKSQESDSLFLSGDEDSEHKKSRSYAVPVIILAFILVMLLLVLVYFLVIVPISGGYTIPQYFNSLFGSVINLSNRL